MGSQVLKILLIGSFGALVSAIVSVITAPKEGSWHEFQGRRLVSLDNKAEPIDEGTQKAASRTLQGRILLDAVLSIVQGYYVDAERVSPSDILEVACFGLRDLDKVPTKLIVKSGAEHCLFELPGFEYESVQGLDHKALVAKSLTVISALDSSVGAISAKGHDLGHDDNLDLYLSTVLKNLDSHSSMLSEEEYKELKQGTQGRFGGLGVVVNVENDILTVIKPIPGSPAEAVGVKAGDRIIAINDVLTFGVSLDDLVDHMRGPPGTQVRMTLLGRKDGISPREVIITRQIVDVPSVEAKVISFEGMRIIRANIESFSATTADELRSAITRLSENHAIAGIIMDLRSNPGGLLDQAIQVADMFLSTGTIVSTSGRRNEIEIAFDENDDIDLPVAILINEETASASEIVASALQDNNRAVVIGSPSFGKGSVQTIFEIPGEKALKLTIARYYSPSGRSIQNAGVVPDVWLQKVNFDEGYTNTLGTARLSNESFQRGHLAAKSKEARLERITSAGYKSFVLDEEGQDISLSLSKEMIVDLAKANGLPVPKDRIRRTFWLANSGQLIKQKTQSWTQKSEKAILENLGISWFGPISISRETRPSIHHGLSVKSPEKILAIEGNKVKIPVEINNRNNRDIDRLSVYVVSEDYQHRPIEMLIGKIPSGKTAKRTLVVDVPPSGKERSFRSFVGLSFDAVPLKNPSNPVWIHTHPRNEPLINYKVSMNSIFNAPQELRFLAPGSRGELVISVDNQSDLKASNLRIGLVNLSGRQVNLMPRDDLSFDLESFGKKVIRVPFQAADRLVSDRFIFGLVIQGPTITTPIKGNFAVSRR